MKIIKDKKKILISCVLIFFILITFIYLGKDNETYSFGYENDYIGDYILNPAWVEYNSLPISEQSKYEVIPEKFIYQYKELDNGISLFNFRNSNLEYYNLNDYGYSTFPENQGSLGICWAFAASSSVETYMLKHEMSNISNPVKISVRQLDYAGVSSDYITEGYNPYAIALRSYPGSGAYPNSAFVLMSSGISPVTNNVFGLFNEDKTVQSLNKVINLDNVEYVVDEYVNYGSLGEHSTSSEREAWVKDIKNHILNYGSISVNTIGPSENYAGSCLYKDSSNNYMLNVRGDCNPVNSQNGHALAIVGWDDNYEYKYCRLNDETSSNLTNCKNVVSGKGAFILKNSWGNRIPYPYLSYQSNVDGAYGVTKVSIKNWDTNYDSTKKHEKNYAYGISTVTYYKSDEISEELKKISFYTNIRKDVAYEVYLSLDGSDNFTKVDEVYTNQIGLITIDLDNIILNSDKFSIKIVSENGYVDKINAFTKDVNVDKEILVDTVISNGNEYGKNMKDFSIYTVTKNVDNGSSLKYIFIDETGNDISNLFSINKSIVLNDSVVPSFSFKSEFPEGKVTFQTLYNNEVYDSSELNIVLLKSLWSGGSGTVDDPFLISSAEDFIKIFTDKDYMSAHYKLVNDIDFSNIENWNSGNISNYMEFTGSLDGDNHIISGLNSNSILPSLFYSVKNANIKNIVFSNINWDVVESGFGSLLSVLAYDSTFENIVITKTVNIAGKSSFAGGIVSTAYNSKFINIANYGNVSTEYAYYGKAAGIVVEAYGSEIVNSYNYGNITGTESVVGGIVSYLGSDYNSSNEGVLRNVYNYGDVKSNIYAGGLVGQGVSSLIEGCYNIFSNSYNNTSNIVGHSYGMVLKNCYYLENTGNSIFYDEDNKSTLINVMAKNVEQLKNKNTYLNFDFDNVWEINNSYPYFKNYNYYYLIDINVLEKLEVYLGDTKNINVNCIPNYNCNVSYNVEDDNIISVDKNGNITGLKEGNTIVRISSLDGSEIVKEINITVKDERINLDNYVIIDNFIKINENYTANDFVNSINAGNRYDVKVLGNNEYIATGDKIEIYDYNNKLISEYTAFVLGDITGDSVIDVGDVGKLYQHIKGAFDMDKGFKLAADVFNDNLLEINDVAKLYQYIKKGIESLED